MIHAADERRTMVERQLRARDITDERVLSAMGSVPREQFVPRWMESDAYADRPLEIGDGQTISQPYVVAYTLQAARIGADDVVLDVGTGSGYAAAVASLIAEQVVSIERITGLAKRARQRMARLGYDNVSVVIGDGSVGHADEAPYDAIVCAAAAPAIPRAWKKQLADGGRIVAPIGTRHGQRLVCVTRDADAFAREDLLDVRYVPLIGDQGFAE